VHTTDGADQPSPAPSPDTAEQQRQVDPAYWRAMRERFGTVVDLIGERYAPRPYGRSK
jgi:hypothetical protein